MIEVIKGKELQGKIMASVNTAELDIYIKYLKQAGIKCRIYTCKNDPEISYLVFNTQLDQKSVFIDFVNVNENIGFFSSNIKVGEDDDLEFVPVDNEIELVIKKRLDKKFIRGESVELTAEGITQFKNKGLLNDFPEGIGEGVIDTISEDGNIAFVFFDGDTKPDARSIKVDELRGVKKHIKI